MASMPKEVFDMQGKTAFITGGTGGIGEALVRSLAAAGASVGFIYRRNEAKAQELEKELSRENLLVRGFRADLGNYEEIAAAIVSGASLFGGYDYLVNNAGILGEHTLILDIEVEDWYRVLQTNLTAPYLVTKCILPYMTGRSGAAMVNVSSLAGKNGGTMGVHYAASKAGLLGFTFHLARELQPLSIRVNAVAPGPVDTPMLSEEDRQRLRALSPNGRIATPEEIARGILFLLTHEYINGEVLDINGGRLMD
mgnify:CR=1 FL=1